MRELFWGVVGLGVIYVLVAIVWHGQPTQGGIPCDQQVAKVNREQPRVAADVDAVLANCPLSDWD